MTKKVYVVGFESNGSISFWDWYLDKKSQDDQIEYLKGRTGLEKLSGVLYYGEVEIENIDNEEDINGILELWLEENNWENSFPHNPNIIL